MIKNIKILIKYICLFLIFGSIYFVIETIYKGHLTHFSMFLLAGFVGIAIGIINEYFSWEMSFWLQCFIGTIVATILEGFTGLIVNVWLGLGVWNYDNVPFAFFYNQVCLPFSVAWYCLSALAIFLDDYIRYWFFEEEKPRYNFKLK